MATVLDDKENVELNEIKYEAGSPHSKLEERPFRNGVQSSVTDETPLQYRLYKRRFAGMLGFVSNTYF